MAKQNIRLENSDIRKILANFFEVDIKFVIPERYSFCIENLTIEEVENKLKKI